MAKKGRRGHNQTSPVADLPQIYTLEQIRNIYDHVDQILSNLDEYALDELFSGNQKDVDTILDTMILETSNALFTNKGPLKTSSFNYLDKVTDQFDSCLKFQSLNYFIISVLPDFELGFHHLEWGNLTVRFPKLGIVAARDHSKSYMFSKAYPLWRMYSYDPYKNNLRKKNQLLKKGMLITDEYTLAKTFLREIKDEIEINPILREKLYPGTSGGTWGEEIICKNKAEMQIKGSGSSMRGRHPGWIIVDDLLNESALYSKDQREKTIDLFHSVIMNMVLPGGQVIVVGTPFHEKDLYGNLKEAKGWRVFEYPGINPDGSVLWPDRYTLQALLDKKEEQGSIRFSREILVNPVSSEASIFPYEILKTAFRGMDQFKLSPNIYSFNKKFRKVTVGCDYAISSSIGADYTVYSVIGVDDLDNFWLLHQWRKQGANYSEQTAMLRKIDNDFKPDVIFAENNAFQKVMIDIAKDAGLHVIPHTTGVNKYDLMTGLPALATLFEMGRIKLPRGDEHSKAVTDSFCSEASGITWTDKGKLENTMDNDDQLMSFWLGIKAAKYVSSSFDFSFI